MYFDCHRYYNKFEHIFVFTLFIAQLTFFAAINDMGIRKLFQSKSVRITVGLLGSAGVIVAALYPIAISPYRHPEEWSKCLL